MFFSRKQDKGNLHKLMSLVDDIKVEYSSAVTGLYEESWGQFGRPKADFTEKLRSAYGKLVFKRGIAETLAAMWSRLENK